jgi:hypothetical protein
MVVLQIVSLSEILGDGAIMNTQSRKGMIIFSFNLLSLPMQSCGRQFGILMAF